MVKPRTKSGGVKFPFIFEKNGRTGRIKRWGDNKFGTYFQFAGGKHRNSFGSFDAAYQYLEREFSKLDTDQANSSTLHPLNHDRKTYSELEQLLREKGGGATLREAIQFFLDHKEHEKFTPKTVAACIDDFLNEEKGRNLSDVHNRTISRHLRHFRKDFGTRRIHEVTSKELWDWLTGFRQENGEPWAVKTRKSVKGTLVGLSIYSRDQLKAIRAHGKTEAQLMKRIVPSVEKEVEIYSPAQMGKLLLTALETDICLIPALVFGGFQGLRPDEFHGENVKDRRQPLQWENIIHQDNLVQVIGKVREKARRFVPLLPITEAWLAPFKDQSGAIWKLEKSYTYKMRNLFIEAKVPSTHNGLRHSFASYRVRHLNGNLVKLADEMGNSPTEILKSYKATVSDKQADEWFSLMPPADYQERIAIFLAQTR